VDPLRCPACQKPMRVIAVIGDPQIVEKILRHLVNFIAANQAYQGSPESGEVISNIFSQYASLLATLMSLQSTI
jgi:hypothetical protein